MKNLRLFIALIVITLVANATVVKGILDSTGLKFVVRQNVGEEIIITCFGTFDLLHISSSEPGRINTHLTITCSEELPEPIVTCDLQKYINYSWVDMVVVDRCKKIDPPSKGFGWRYSLSTSPSECYDAPEGGMPGLASGCLHFSELPSGFEVLEDNKCAFQQNVIKGCPPSCPPSEYNPTSEPYKCNISNSSPSCPPTEYKRTLEPYQCTSNSSSFFTPLFFLSSFITLLVFFLL